MSLHLVFLLLLIPVVAAFLAFVFGRDTERNRLLVLTFFLAIKKERKKSSGTFWEFERKNLLGPLSRVGNLGFRVRFSRFFFFILLYVKYRLMFNGVRPFAVRSPVRKQSKRSQRVFREHNKPLTVAFPFFFFLLFFLLNVHETSIYIYSLKQTLTHTRGVTFSNRVRLRSQKRITYPRLLYNPFSRARH